MSICHPEPQLKGCHSEPQLKKCHVFNLYPEPQLKGYHTEPQLKECHNKETSHKSCKTLSLIMPLKLLFQAHHTNTVPQTQDIHASTNLPTCGPASTNLPAHSLTLQTSPPVVQHQGWQLGPGSLGRPASPWKKRRAGQGSELGGPHRPATRVSRPASPHKMKKKTYTCVY